MTPSGEESKYFPTQVLKIGQYPAMSIAVPRVLQNNLGEGALCEQTRRPQESRPQDQEHHPLTDEVIRQHLAGELTVGAYPLLLDETCCFLAVDFDKKTWQEDAAAFLGTCQE